MTDAEAIVLLREADELEDNAAWLKRYEEILAQLDPPLEIDS